MNKIVKTAAEFKTEISDIIRALPLKQILLVPDSYIENTIKAWLELNENGVSPAQEEYKKYYQMLTSLPDDTSMLDIDLYMFKIARKIVDTMMLTMIETRYYENIFSQAQLEKDDYEYFLDVIDEIMERVSNDLSGNPNILRGLSDLRNEFGNYAETILNE